jgi:hypothetical protein
MGVIYDVRLALSVIRAVDIGRSLEHARQGCHRVLYDIHNRLRYRATFAHVV